MRAFFIVLLFTVASQSWSQEQNLVEQRKYCGSGLTRSIVPEKPLGCDMSNACMKHDVCYGRCDPKGDRHGTEYCTKSEFSIPRLASKAQCDSAFFAEIRKKVHSTDELYQLNPWSILRTHQVAPRAPETSQIYLQILMSKEK